MTSARNWAIGVAVVGLFAYGFGKAAPGAIQRYFLQTAGSAMSNHFPNNFASDSQGTPEVNSNMQDQRHFSQSLSE